MQISIIIPTWNETENISQLVPYLLAYGQKSGHLCEIIVVDGGSEDDTLAAARKAGATAYLCPQKGRASQMNYGAKLAKGDMLYFVHADAIPPSTYVADILAAVAEGFEVGCYRFAFKSDRKLLKINAFCTRFDWLFLRGGDQTLFVKKADFERLNGFRSDYLIMEDYDFIARIRQEKAFKIIPKNTLISARKYEKNSYLRVQLANLCIVTMYRLGYPQAKMVLKYSKLLNYR